MEPVSSGDYVVHRLDGIDTVPDKRFSQLTAYKGRCACGWQSNGCKSEFSVRNAYKEHLRAG